MPLVVVNAVAEVREHLSDSDAPVIAVPVFNAPEQATECYTSLLAHTPAATDLLVIDDAGTDRRVVEWLEQAQGDDRLPLNVVVLNHDSNRGFVKSVNEAFDAAGRRDVIVVNSDVVVGPEWYDRLVAAAGSSGAIGTVSTLSNNATIVSVPQRNQPSPDLPPGLTVEDASRRIAEGASLTRPQLPTGIGHCLYVRRALLDIVGPFDEAFSPGYGEEVDLSLRGSARGFRHVLADDVFVFHHGGASFGDTPARDRLRAEHEALVIRRYPSYHGRVWDVASDEDSDLAEALRRASVALRGLRLAVDASCLRSVPVGTQVGTINAIRALARRPGIADVAVFVPPHLPEHVLDQLRVPKVRLGRIDQLPQEDGVDIVFRPFQVTELYELQRLTAAHRPLVVWQLDLIAFHTAAYFPSTAAWQRYRRTSKAAAAVADGVALNSTAVQREAHRSGLVHPDTPQAVVYCGVDHARAVTSTPCQRPAALRTPVNNGFVLVLGVAYSHKNRPFAIRLLAALAERGWHGDLVLAGLDPPHGSSVADEDDVLRDHPSLRARAHRLGGVSEAEKVWLYRNAGLVLYPTLDEGFGLVPFEAAAAGTPCLATRSGSLDEVLPRDIPTLAGFDPAVAADVALVLLTDDDAAQELCRALMLRAADFTWDGVAARLDALFGDVLQHPRPRAAALLRAGARQQRATHARAVSRRLVELVSHTRFMLRRDGFGSTLRHIAAFLRRRMPARAGR